MREIFPLFSPSLAEVVVACEELELLVLQRAHSPLQSLGFPLEVDDLVDDGVVLDRPARESFFATGDRILS